MNYIFVTIIYNTYYFLRNWQIVQIILQYFDQINKFLVKYVMKVARHEAIIDINNNLICVTLALYLSKKEEKHCLEYQLLSQKRHHTNEIVFDMKGFCIYLNRYILWSCEVMKLDFSNIGFAYIMFISLLIINKTIYFMKCIN